MVIAMVETIMVIAMADTDIVTTRDMVTATVVDMVIAMEAKKEAAKLWRECSYTFWRTPWALWV